MFFFYLYNSTVAKFDTNYNYYFDNYCSARYLSVCVGVDAMELFLIQSSSIC